MSDKKEFDWFDQPRNVKKLKFLMYGVCVLSVVAEFVLSRTGHPRESHFSWDDWTGFYAVLGFLACAGSILLAKGLGFFLKKDEDYYDHD